MKYENILKCFSHEISKQIYSFMDIYNNFEDELEEIRIRANLPIILKFGNKSIEINYKVSRKEIEQTMQIICENSIYSYQSQIANGYITINGGHRVGIVGSAVLENNKVINLNYISSLNFRISREIEGCSNEILKYIIDYKNNNIFTTLIVSSPGLGKTTLLKDIIRNLSDGIYEKEFIGVNVCVIDERGEIGATYKGVAQNNLGIRTDIIGDIPKSIRNENGN